MDGAAWLEISLTVDGELAEAVAEVIGRYTPGGVAIESTAIIANAEDEGRAIGPLRVCGYLPFDDNLEDTRRQVEQALWYLGRISPLPPINFRPIPQVNWVEAWKEHYHPIPVGEKIIIIPAWLETPPGDRSAIRIDPGMAFGTGSHPTTQLCLELIEKAIEMLLSDQQENPISDPLEFIDIGCGSGILAIAALKLGAASGIGVDIDADAVNAAAENVLLNGEAERFKVGLGSVREIIENAFGQTTAPLVFANILAGVLVKLFAEGLGELVKPGGYLILSGILEEACSEVESSLSDRDLELIERRQQGDWVALLAKKPG